MTTKARELHDIDEKLAAVKTAKEELMRLEQFLMARRQALTGDLKGTYGSVMAGVGVSDQEVKDRVQHALDLAARWKK